MPAGGPVWPRATQLMQAALPGWRFPDQVNGALSSAGRAKFEITVNDICFIVSGERVLPSPGPGLDGSRV